MSEKENKLPIVGVYTFCSTGSVLIHKLEEERVLASVNGNKPHWCPITEEWNEDEEEWESGFYIHPGSFFVPFSQTTRADI